MNFLFTGNGNAMRWAVCLLLCASSWRGPVPMLHSHDDLTGTEFLQHHEAAFHTGDQGGHHLGLHWHLAFPEDVTGRPCQDSQPPAPELAVFACANALPDSPHRELSVTLCGSTACIFLTVFSEGHIRSRLNRKHCCAHSFFESLSTGMPLVAITGVCLV